MESTPRTVKQHPDYMQVKTIKLEPSRFEDIRNFGSSAIHLFSLCFHLITVLLQRKVGQPCDNGSTLACDSDLFDVAICSRVLGLFEGTSRHS